jgi:hypothetical protein
MMTAAQNLLTGEVVIGTSINHDKVRADRPGVWVEGYLCGTEFVTKAEAERQLKAEHDHAQP